MLGKFVIIAVALILATPIYAGTGGGSSGSAGSTGSGAGAGGHSGGGSGGGGAGHGGGANGSGGRGGGLSGRAAAATTRGVAYGHEPSSHAGISHTDAMHATHLAGDKHSAGEHTTSKSPGKDHRYHPSRREPFYGAAIDQREFLTCMPTYDRNSKRWFDCNGPTKSFLWHKS